MHILVYDIPVLRADIYGDMLTVDRGHAEIWEALAALGMKGLAQRRLPGVLLVANYDEFPRGRVVYDPAAKRFTVWADPKLHRPDIVEALKGGFLLGSAACRVLRDDHYRTAGSYDVFDAVKIHQLAPLLWEQLATGDSRSKPATFGRPRS